MADLFISELITACKRSCGKVMFLHLSVMLFTGGTHMVKGGMCGEGGMHGERGDVHGERGHAW